MKLIATARVFPHIVLLFCLCLVPAVYAEFDHSLWDSLLSRNVVSLNQGLSTQVDYDAMLDERAQLQDYLGNLSKINKQDFDTWLETEQLAFLINAYNAWTLELVLTRYPELDSIKDLGSLFRSPFSIEFIPLFGETVSLDYIEHELIRGPDGYGDPRIHFAVNCASIGCPALRGEAYRGTDLEQQLEEATVLFLSDRSRNRMEGNNLLVSKIFDWYEEDFESGWRSAASVSEFLALFATALDLSPQTTARLQANDIRIRNLKYNWDLNRTTQ